MTSRSTPAGKPTVREIAELALICALMLAGKEALRVIPNVHPITLLILLCVRIYGKRALYPTFAFVFLEIGLYGAGIWNVMYLYTWPLLVLVALPFRKSDNRLFWAALAGIHGFLFGALCAIPYLFIGGLPMAAAWWVSGIPYDVIHGVSNMVLTFVLLPPLYQLMLRRRNEQMN